MVIYLKRIVLCSCFRWRTSALNDMSAEDATEWLVAMGYTLEFVTSVFFLFMCVLEVFSELCDMSINYASPSYRFG